MTPEKTKKIRENDGAANDGGASLARTPSWGGGCCGPRVGPKSGQAADLRRVSAKPFKRMFEVRVGGEGGSEADTPKVRSGRGTVGNNPGVLAAAAAAAACGTAQRPERAPPHFPLAAEARNAGAPPNGPRMRSQCPNQWEHKYAQGLLNANPNPTKRGPSWLHLIDEGGKMEESSAQAAYFLLEGSECSL